MKKQKIIQVRKLFDKNGKEISNRMMYEGIDKRNKEQNNGK